MSQPHPLFDELTALIACRFQLFGEPMRLRLARPTARLRGDRAGAGGCAETSQQNVSKHLALLAEAGIVARRKDGTRVHYRVSDDEVFDVGRGACGSLEHQFRGLAALAEDLASGPTRVEPQVYGV